MTVLTQRSELTSADRNWAALYQPADVLYYTRGSRELGIERATYATVVSTDPKANQLTVEREDGQHVTYDPKRLHGIAAYRRIARDFAEGDRLQFTVSKPDMEIRNRDLATVVFARLLYDVQFWMKSDDRVPITFVCDEAHLYLPVADEADSIAQRALDTFERIAKEGRKYGVSLLVVSQRPADVSRTILSQCNNFLALRLSNDQDQAVIRRLMPESMAAITDILPLLDIGEALLLGDAVVLPTSVKLDPPAIKPSSATKLFWTEWQLKPSEESSISSGVECLRRQSRI